ncbi:hypothetical protein A1Q1_04286 [Trichosporon asahii var. asahii CBS 2479]|uniref:Postreplication repair E3 ubiquitin-protein ligase RAD18 n=1 Tax=Trichosporon asahii var. asahii (strain ATCC 90039 / CBS 2479 / JCM 2466 / KCTC 7840 / NBRC 103889/ NCYC 2677 / UAMH 7654) TaxID=1186058 RepID=J5QF94_TRIAS|nr:hypothetical protein A1Q1_04286 [Trichosporon asahii var. asahii CBS 2479]EJT47043.1 hypothetical protein A1Q1_04286 [Trichosporon asahii var. asahii CBS 2479]
MDLNHPLLQADVEPKPFPESQPQLRRLDKALLCPICKELFDHPVSIGCGHSFCSKCIRGFFASTTKKTACPTCSDPQTEGSIRRNRVLEEIPKLVDLVQPPPARKRRNSLPRRSPTKKSRGEGSSRSSPQQSRGASDDDDDDDVVELAESGLAYGDRPALEARFQQWTVMYNANMDSSHPASLSKLRADLERAEASRRKDKERGKDEEVEALQTSDGLKKYAAEHKSDFERLRQDILERKRRKSQGGLKDSPIEVE